jgi:hypothetical protein
VSGVGPFTKFITSSTLGASDFVARRLRAACSSRSASAHSKPAVPSSNICDRIAGVDVEIANQSVLDDSEIG